MERLSEPLQLTNSDKVADNAVNTPNPNRIGNGRRKAEPKYFDKISVPSMIIKNEELNIANDPRIDF